MLYDRARINVRGGHGGSGSASFRREKYVPKGGPDGGDGGRGGDVVLVASRQVRDLSPFARRAHHRAANGAHGRGGNRRGADGGDLCVSVPIGTEVHDERGELIADLIHEGERAVVATGGEGGRGNVCFASSTRQAPHFAERGLPGDEGWLDLTLKLLADVGLVGLPNAGKSSLLAALTRARPKIAPYPFTTLEPNLGTIALEDATYVLADIPGLVEGASRGVGLGDRFLAHIERTAVLVYVVDASVGRDAVREAFATVHDELEAFKPALGERPALVALNKSDLLDRRAMEWVREGLQADVRLRASVLAAPIAVSALRGDGLEELVAALGAAVRPAPAAAAPRAVPVLRPQADQLRAYSVTREGGGFRVSGVALERLVAKADIDNEEAVAYLQEVMERAGVSAALRKAGAVPGDTVVVGEQEFEFA